MNQSFRVIFQAASGTFTAVSELTKSKGKTKSSRSLCRAAVAGVLVLSSGLAAANDFCELPNGDEGEFDPAGLCVAKTTAITPLTGVTPFYDAGGANPATPANAVAIGSNAYATGSKDVAIGMDSLADTASSTGTYAVAIGFEANAIGGGSTAIGAGAVASNGNNTQPLNATAIGSNAQATAANSTALGHLALASGQDAIALGANAKASSLNSTTLGDSSNASGVGASALGFGANASGNASIAIGGSQFTANAASATSGESIAIGEASKSQAAGAVALGGVASATGVGSVALGQNSVADRGNAVSVGSATLQRKIINVDAGDQATDAVNFGQLTTTNSNLATLSSTVNTTNSNLSALSTTVVTNTSNITTNSSNITTNTSNIASLESKLGSGSIGLVQQAGAGAKLTVGAGADGTMIDFTGTSGLRTLTGAAAGNLAAGSTDVVNGAQLFATNNNVATNTSNITSLTTRMGDAETNINDLAGQIGSGTVGLVQQSAVGVGATLTVGAKTDGTVVDFTGTSGVRTLTGVAAGINADDAVNMTQLTATNNNVTALDGRVGKNEGDITVINKSLADLGSSLNGAVVYNADKSMVSLGGVSGTKIDNLMAGLVGAGSMQAVNGGQLFSMKADLDKQLQDIVDNADAAIGIIGSKLDDLTGTVGKQQDKLDDLDGRVGTIEQGIADGTIGGGGTGDGTNAAGNVELGKGTTASGKNSSAIGSGAVASGENSSAVGANASATGKDSTAVGADSKATGNSSVAIGAGSVADRDNSVSFGSAGNERQLTNVADGTAPTDAVNKRQLDGAIAGVNERIDRLDTRVDEMGAMSSAQAQMAMSTSGLLGNNRLGVGIGAQNGQSALALGYQRVYGQGMRTLSVGGAASTRGTVSVGAGAGFAW